MFTKIVISSLLDRKASIFLTLVAMTISIFVILAVENIRHQTKKNFESSLSGTDLIIGSKSGSLNLLLYSVFRVGAPTNNISWTSFKKISNDSKVKWSIPLSLGDSHKGFPVLGTNSDYFKYFRYGQKEKLQFRDGKPFDQIFDVVIGSEISKKMNYKIGDKIILSHGLNKNSLQKHNEYPFKIVGILEPTGTPVDRTVHIKLGGIELIHIGWRNGVQVFDNRLSKKELKAFKMEPKFITAFMVGLESKLNTFSFQRTINNFVDEPLLAILPGVVLAQLWETMGFVEQSLLFVAILVFISACFGVSAVLLNSMRERRGEMKLLRVVGATPLFIFCLIEMETVIITLLAISLALIFHTSIFILMTDFIMGEFGVPITAYLNPTSLATVIGAVLITTVLVGVIPAVAAYAESFQND